MSFSRPTRSDVIARMRADVDGRLPGADSRMPRSLIDVLLRTYTGAIDGLYGYLDSIAAASIYDTATGTVLERWAGIWGVQRKGSLPAAGSVTLSGVDGSVVIDQAVLLRADGAEFLVSGPVALTGGAATTRVTASAAGAAGNTLAGTALGFASPSAGVAASAVVAAPGIVGGGDEESDAELLARFLARIRQAPNGGSQADYLAWALAQPDVTRAWVYPGWTGAGTVGLAFVMDGRPDIFPLTADVDAMAAAIAPLRPVTADVVVFAPTPQPVNFILGVTPATAKPAVIAELTDLFAREAAPVGTILISHIREAISVALGVTDYDLRAPVANVAGAPGAMPVLVTIGWID